MHVTQVHPVTSENQFHFTRLYCLSMRCNVLHFKQTGGGHHLAVLPDWYKWRWQQAVTWNGLITTSWCGEIGSLTSLDACKLGAFSDVREPMGLVRITSWYPNFNGSHFGLPLSEIHRMTGLPSKIVWTMTYSHRPHLTAPGCILQVRNKLSFPAVDSSRLIDLLILLEAQQAKNAYSQGIPDTNIEGD